jgi:hypothetical protein
MRIIELTPDGHSIARSPNGGNTGEWRLIYFLDRRGGKATDDQVTTFGNMNRKILNDSIRNLTRMKPPIVRVIG